jgi:thiol-disulfide isomerase/thioredoxin
MMCACGGQGEPTEDYSEDTEEMSTGPVAEIPEFHSIDLEGNEVDNSIFEDATVTVINVWGTFCPPCIDEMPDLAEWAEELPANVQMIGIVMDVESADAEEFEEAKRIVAESGVPYTNIIAGDQFVDGFFDQIVGVPTTFFVDSEGKCVAEPVLGADVEAYKKTVEGLL